jgi:hypothetical protein
MVSSNSVALLVGDGGRIYISPNRARQLRKQKAASVVSFQLFVLRLVAANALEDCAVQVWGRTSDGRKTKMSGAFFTKHPPRP